MAPIPSEVIKRDGRKEQFNQTKIFEALDKCFSATGKSATFSELKSITDEVIKKFPSEEPITRDDIDDYLIKTLKEEPKHFEQAKEYESFRIRRLNASKILVPKKNGNNSTDLNLLIEGNQETSLTTFDPAKIRAHLERQHDLGLSETQINVISKHVENEILDLYEKRENKGENFILNTEVIKAFVSSTMGRMGFDPASILKSGNYGLDRDDLEQLIHTKTEENANVGTNNPEAVAMGIWETILKKYALNEIFDKELKEAHLKGKMHIHDLGYCTRVYCSGHSLAYTKLFGLDLDNLDTSSNPPKAGIALSGLLSTFLASMQAYYAGALGLSYLNLEFAPYVEGMDKQNINKVVEGVKEFISGDENLKKNLDSFMEKYSLISEGAKKLQSLNLEKLDLEEIISKASSKIKDKELVSELNSIKKNYLIMKTNSGMILENVIDGKELNQIISGVSKYLEGDKELKENFDYVMSRYTDMNQIAQNLIFTQSQSAFSRGGQTLFIDFNLHTEVPELLRDIPIVCPKGVYRICNKDGTEREDLIRIKDKSSKNGLIFKDRKGAVLVNEKGDFNRSYLDDLGKRFVTYKDYEPEAQLFLEALLDLYKAGDSNGKMFAFPKCDIHVDKNSFENERSKELLRKGCEVAAENSSAYFIFDRDAVTMAACCRLKTSIDPKALEHPESLRFCGFQNVTINLPQAAYRAKEKGKGDLDGLVDEVLDTMDLAYKAHIQKRKFTQSLMLPGMPLWQIGKPSQDGDPYVDLDKATYIIGMLGLNEAIKTITGEELHESERAIQSGEELIAAMYQRKEEYIKLTKTKENPDGWKFSIEESPAESAARNLAKRDLHHKVYGNFAREVIQGTESDPYYTNSVHYRADAENVSGIDRVRDLSRFHPLIESGAIIHLFTGENEISSDAVFDLLENTYKHTQCSQITVSGAHSSCRECGVQIRGFIDLCPKCSSKEIDWTEKVVGYNSKVANWNPSKKEELKARDRGNYGVDSHEIAVDRNKIQLDSSKPYLKAVVFGKKGCEWCDNLKENIYAVIKDKDLSSKVEVEFVDLKSDGKEGRQNLARAARAGMNFGSIPGMGIEYGQTELNIPVDGFDTLVTEGYLRRDKKTFDLMQKSKLISNRNIEHALMEADDLIKDYIVK